MIDFKTTPHITPITPLPKNATSPPAQTIYDAAHYVITAPTLGLVELTETTGDIMEGNTHLMMEHAYQSLAPPDPLPHRAMQARLYDHIGQLTHQLMATEQEGHVNEVLARSLASDIQRYVTLSTGYQPAGNMTSLHTQTIG